MLMPPLQLGPFLKRGPREDVAGLARVDADAGRVLVEQAVDDVDLGLQRRQRLQARAQLHVGAGALGPPVRRVDAAAHEQRGEPLRAGRGHVAGHRRGAPDGDRLEPGQGHRHAHAAEERPPRRRRAGLLVRFRARIRSCSSFLRLFAFDSLVQKLRAGDDALDQAAEAVAVGRQPRAHAVRWSRRPRAAGCVPGHRPAACGTGCRRIRPAGARRDRRAGRRLRSLRRRRETSRGVSTGRPPRSTVRDSPTGP